MSSDIISKASYNDMLDDLGPLKGMPWQRFNNFCRVIRQGAVSRGRAIPTRASVMHAVLDLVNALTVESLNTLIDECVQKREAEDARRRGTRTRGLTKKETRRWSGR